ncbi:hypothetical protein LCGC14_1536920 [marine sediment metagenome]|uniref:Uncharacterized protein n=1 Tax=marine sediment metagenome TaxID=412755 RepID=A0A0F9IU97_9ZZZZ
MAGTPRSGNPNIIEDTKGKQTGPKTEIGKFKASINAAKWSKAIIKDQNGKKSLITKMMEEAGIDFSKVEDALEKQNLFTIWAKSKSTKDLTEIQRLDTVIRILESDTAVRAMDKLEKGLPLDDSDLKLIKLLKESLESSHRMKFGDKHLHAHASYDDIRKMMFDDNS